MTDSLKVPYRYLKMEVDSFIYIIISIVILVLSGVGSARKKKAQKENDMKVLEEYIIQIDQDALEIARLETALKKNLPVREVELQLRQLKDRTVQFIKLKELIERRQK